jgi:hypothetical protein
MALNFGLKPFSIVVNNCKDIQNEMLFTSFMVDGCREALGLLLFIQV